MNELSTQVVRSICKEPLRAWKWEKLGRSVFSSRLMRLERVTGQVDDDTFFSAFYYLAHVIVILVRSSGVWRLTAAAQKERRRFMR